MALLLLSSTRSGLRHRSRPIPILVLLAMATLSPLMPVHAAMQTLAESASAPAPAGLAAPPTAAPADWGSAPRPGESQTPPQAAGAAAPAAEPSEAVPGNAAAPARREDGVFTVAVFGDSMAEGIWGGIFRKLQRNHRFEVLRRARHSTGLSRPDYYDWQQALDAFLDQDPIDAAVVSVGLNDIQALYVEGSRSYRFGTEAWDRAYRERVEALMDRLHRRNIPTFWIGLPIMRNEDRNSDVEHLNAIYRESASAHGVTFIPTWQITVDDHGGFSSYLRDDEGRSRLMRANDGVHFTPRGYDMLADFVLHAMQIELPAMAAAGQLQ